MERHEHVVDCADRSSVDYVLTPESQAVIDAAGAHLMAQRDRERRRAQAIERLRERAEWDPVVADVLAALGDV